MVCLFTTQLTPVPNYLLLGDRGKYVNNLRKVALDSAAAGTNHAISSRKFNALTSALLSHTPSR